jgi:hypothetical protein
VEKVIGGRRRAGAHGEGEFGRRGLQMAEVSDVRFLDLCDVSGREGKERRGWGPRATYSWPSVEEGCNNPKFWKMEINGFF